jgi:soluble lytic murein transglycosylase
LEKKGVIMKLFQKKYIFSLILLLFIVFLFYNTDGLGRFMYPIKYKQDIQISSENYNMDPLLISAIIRVESNYNPSLESAKGARGLMQIMPDTADWIIIKAGYTPLIKDHMKEPDVNIEMGTWYLNWIVSRFDGKLPASYTTEDRLAVTAAAYNAGHNKLSEWLSGDVWDGQYQNIADIPYGETRHYIKRVLYYYKKYQMFYAEEPFVN